MDIDLEISERILTFVDSSMINSNIKSKIKFETHALKTCANLLNVKIILKSRTFISSVYSKPTDTNLYLNQKF